MPLPTLKCEYFMSATSVFSILNPHFVESADKFRVKSLSRSEVSCANAPYGGRTNNKNDINSENFILFSLKDLRAK
jgi:hypothetical protein